MNGYHQFSTHAFPLDSNYNSAMMNYSDSSGFSSSGGMSHTSVRYPPPPNLLTNGGQQMTVTKVQNQTYFTQQNPGGLQSYYDQTPVQAFRHQGQGPTIMRSHSGGKPAAMVQMHEDDESKSTDHFLSQFQAQMSQMKSAMDAVQNEIFHSVGVGGGKPAGMGAFTSIKRGPGRPRSVFPSSTPQGASVRYQSQINGLKLKIKKSPRQLKRKGSKTKGRKKKKKAEEEDEDEISEEEEDYRRPSSVPKSTKAHTAGDENDSEGGRKDPTGWGDRLPENVLERIFAHAVRYEEGCIPVLVRASKVSRLWWKTASKKELWTSVDLSSPRVKDKFKIERNLIYFLEHKFPGVKHLNLGGWSTALTNAAIDVMIRCCKDLESLGLNGCQKLTAQNLKIITETCQCLKKLDLSSISTTYNTKSAVSTTALGDAAETMSTRLVHLSLASNCLASCPQIIASLAEHCPNLQALDLSNVTSPRRDSIVINMEDLQKGCQKLKILRLTNSDFILAETTLKEQVSSPGLPDLEELSIAVDPKRSPGMSEGDLERIVKGANKLRLLDVRGCSRIGDSGLVRICAWDLEHLYLSGCYATKSSNDGLELVARKWRHSFKEIDFSWTPGEQTINSSMKALAEGDGDSDVMPPLRVLDLCGSSVSFESVKLALKTCLQLERLNLTSCRALPRGIKRNYQSFEEVTTLREQVLAGKFDDHEND